MKYRYRRNDGIAVSEAEALDENGLLRDGYTMSVPCMMRDGITRRIRKETRDPQGRLLSTSIVEEEEVLDDDISALADAGVRFVDVDGRPAGHRPGFCIPTDLELIRARRAVAGARAEAAKRDEDAWRDPPKLAGAAAVPAEVPDRLTADALQCLDERERAWREAQLADENAWRNPRR